MKSICETKKASDLEPGTFFQAVGDRSIWMVVRGSRGNSQDSLRKQDQYFVRVEASPLFPEDDPAPPTILEKDWAISGWPFEESVTVVPIGASR